MGSYETVTALRSSILTTAAAAVTDIGVQLVTLEPLGQKKVEWLESYVAELSGGEKEIRGMHLLPGTPFHRSSPEATGGLGYTWFDTWKWDIYIFRAAQKDATKRDAALERACKIMDALRKDTSITGVDLMMPATVTLREHGWAQLGRVGVWTSELSAEFQVAATEALT